MSNNNIPTPEDVKATGGIDVHADGGFTVTGENGIRVYQLLAMRGALKMEVAGLRGRTSVYARVKRDFNLHGSKAKVLAQFEDLLRANGVIR